MVTRRIPRGNFVYLCAWSRVCTGNVLRRIRAPVRTDMGDPRVTYLAPTVSGVVTVRTSVGV